MKEPFGTVQHWIERSNLLDAQLGNDMKRELRRVNRAILNIYSIGFQEAHGCAAFPIHFSSDRNDNCVVILFEIGVT